jgi:leucyl-tRNA synthetase
VVEAVIEVPVQVNGKLRGRVQVMVGASDEDMLAAALASEAVQAHLAGMDVVKTVVANGRLVSIVVRPPKG